MGRKSIKSKVNIAGKKAMLRRWTQSAIECYNIGCDCSKCQYSRILLTPCQMRNTVILLVKKFGKPKETDLENIDDIE